MIFGYIAKKAISSDFEAVACGTPVIVAENCGIADCFRRARDRLEQIYREIAES